MKVKFTEEELAIANNHLRALKPQHKKNLRKLTDYVASLPKGYKHFDMRRFLITSAGSNVKATEFLGHCGSSACFLGHGPSAGISTRGIKPQRYGCDWREYSTKKFGLTARTDVAWVWLFGPEWSEYPRTRTLKAAVRRTEQFIEAGYKITPAMLDTMIKYSVLSKGWMEFYKMP